MRCIDSKVRVEDERQRAGAVARLSDGDKIDLDGSVMYFMLDEATAHAAKPGETALFSRPLSSGSADPVVSAGTPFATVYGTGREQWEYPIFDSSIVIGAFEQRCSAAHAAAARAVSD